MFFSTSRSDSFNYMLHHNTTWQMNFWRRHWLSFLTIDLLSYPILSNNSVRKSKSINMKRWRRALRMIKIVWFTPYPVHTEWLSYSLTICCLYIRMRSIKAPWHFRVSFIGANIHDILSNRKSSIQKSIPNSMKTSKDHHVSILWHQIVTNSSFVYSLWLRVSSVISSSTINAFTSQPNQQTITNISSRFSLNPWTQSNYSLVPINNKTTHWSLRLLPSDIGLELQSTSITIGHRSGTAKRKIQSISWRRNYRKWILISIRKTTQCFQNRVDFIRNYRHSISFPHSLMHSMTMNGNTNWIVIYQDHWILRSFPISHCIRRLISSNVVSNWIVVWCGGNNHKIGTMSFRYSANW